MKKRALGIKGCRRNKRGFSLVELVVAIAVMSIITATLSMILGNTLSLYNKGESTSVLYSVSQKLHDSLNRELVASQSVVLYESESNDQMVSGDYQSRLYLKDGRIMKCHQENGKKEISEILLSINSYRNCEVKSFIIKYDSVEERVSYYSDEIRQCYRVIYLTTVLSLNGQEYEHTSAVRLYSMYVSSDEIQMKLKDGKNTIITADASHKNREFTSCIYTYSQSFSQVENS